MKTNKDNDDEKMTIKHGKWHAWDTLHQWQYEIRCVGDDLKPFNQNFDTVKSLFEFFFKQFDQELSRGKLTLDNCQLLELKGLFESANITNIIFDEVVATVVPCRLLCIKLHLKP